MIELEDNQSALILEIDEDGEVEINVAAGDHDCVTARICKAIAKKLMEDETFQEEIMSSLDDES